MARDYESAPSKPLTEVGFEDELTAEQKRVALMEASADLFDALDISKTVLIEYRVQGEESPSVNDRRRAHTERVLSATALSKLHMFYDITPR